MSWICSAGSEGSHLDWKGPECEPSRSARSSHSPAASSPSTGQMSPAMTTLEPSPPIASQQTAFEWMSSAEASPARISASQALERGLRASGADYGLSTPELLANYDPASSSWRTSQHCLVEGLTEFSETWPRSGMMRSGIAYQLPPLVRLTDATEFGLWPTPTVGGGGQTLPEGTTPTGMTPDGRKQTVCLERYAQQVERRIWPTPRANDAEKRGDFDATNPRNGLPAAVKMFPTPTRSMHKGSSANAMTRSSGASRLNDRLDYAVERGIITTGRLNPLWVAWLMGFPTEWASFAPMATPSSRKSRKSSDERS
jgi:hypothetical protein